MFLRFSLNASVRSPESGVHISVTSVILCGISNFSNFPKVKMYFMKIYIIKTPFPPPRPERQKIPLFPCCCRDFSISFWTSSLLHTPSIFDTSSPYLEATTYILWMNDKFEEITRMFTNTISLNIRLYDYIFGDCATQILVNFTWDWTWVPVGILLEAMSRIKIHNQTITAPQSGGDKSTWGWRRPPKSKLLRTAGNTFLYWNFRIQWFFYSGHLVYFPLT